MPRKLRIKIPGYYHIINRGVERRNVFLKSEDYDKFLELLADMKKVYNITVHAYCLMTNHYHILIETKDENISEAIQFLNSFYSMYFNKEYKRSGHLWQGRFSSYFLYDDAHFWIVTKYIERNPIKAKMVNKVDAYVYQSFYLWKNNKNLSLLEDSMIKDMTIREYEEYISTDLQVNALDTVYISPKYIKVDGKLKVLSKRLETFFELDKDIDRTNNIRRAFSYGYTKTEIANFLGLSTNTINKRLRPKP